MKTAKEIIISSIQESLEKLKISKEVVLTEAKNYGDYSTNIALTLQKQLGRKATEIAQEIVRNIDLNKYKEISEIKVADPGFINFWVSNSVLADTVNLINELGSNYGNGLKEGKGKINVEFVSANPTGYLHIGHARNAAIGATLSNILEKAGHTVIREYLVNDYGNQMNKLAISIYSRYQQIFNKNYELPEDAYRGGDIVEFADEFYKQYKDKYKDVEYTPEIEMFFREFGRSNALKNIEEDLKKFGVWFDLYTSEKEQYEKDLVWPAIRRLKTTYVKDGATWLQTTKGGKDDKDRVIIKGNGDSTYLCADIAYHEQKFRQLNDPQNGVIIDVWGADHSGYVERVKFAFEDLGYRRDQIEVILFQLIRIMKDGKEIKMSKRLGTSLTLRELMSEVGKDAIRFFLIERSYNSKIDFDIKKVTSADETNSMYIIKYAHARCVQLLEKLNYENPKATELNDEFSQKIVAELKEYPDLIATISKTYKVNLLPPYLLKLASAFNSFYSNIKVLDSKNEESYAALVKAVKNVLADAMKLMDLEIPNKM
ncbi:arginine--tRNA ligase [Metamycoplasma canadense]|uniref:Arginine--tRNA ligase n=1 Tax=Metamycoplasma canadense TaxID=29554 RepID=A0A077LBJ0_9BACT|nr:arginine--tRNA ligase [Metamycoplasma canadense]BAP39494.1 arginyl-tRNA synthetase [Metamycoplasma canadense]